MKGINHNRKRRLPGSSTAPRQKPATPVKNVKTISDSRGKGYTRPLLVAVILLITFAAYFPSLNNDLLKTWDDQAYITNNTLIKTLSAESILKIFKEDKGMYANYHPLTTLSLAVNYHFSKEEPFGYHLVNLLLHLLNTLLVFVFIYFLTRKNLEIAAVAALLFGLNPMHVESVAWISERKDVLYAFFFLASVVSYQQFLRRSDWKWYALTLFLFLCSMLSKAMAASLPLVLILIGFMETRRWSWKLLPDKIPFFIIALLLGLYAIRIQAEGNAIGSITFPLGMRILHACYGYALYILKIFIPVGLSAFYPYPYPLINASWITNTMPPVLYITLPVTLVIFIFSLWALASGKKTLQAAGFGLLFYGVTIAMVLQFLPVGRAIMADRYAYIPSVGLALIPAFIASLLYAKKNWRTPVIVMLALYAGFLFYQTRQQTRLWKNDGTLWSNVIDLYPADSRVTLAYSNRAQYLQSEGKPKEALQDMLLVAQWNPKDDNALDRIGRIYGKDMHDLQGSIRYFQMAYQLNPKNLDAIIDLATVYGMTGDFNRSLEFSLKGLEIDKNDAALLYNAGITYSNLGQVKLGKDYMDRAIKTDPSLNRH